MKPKRCFYCRGELLARSCWNGIGREPDNLASTDHVYPHRLRRELGPRSDRWHRLNKVHCCTACNNRKGDLHPAAWLDQLHDMDARHRLADRLKLLADA